MVATTPASSSVMRSSTSRCFTADSSRRSALSLSCSRAFMADLMSSLSCSRRGIEDLQMTAASGALSPGSPRGFDETCCLVQLRREHLRAHALVAALHRGGVLALALGGRLLVELAGAQLGEEAGFLDRALEAAESHVE